METEALRRALATAKHEKLMLVAAKHDELMRRGHLNLCLTLTPIPTLTLTLTPP